MMDITFEELEEKYPSIVFYKELNRLSDGKLFKIGDVIKDHQWPNTIVALDIFKHPGYIVNNINTGSFIMYRAIFSWSLYSNQFSEIFTDLETLK